MLQAQVRWIATLSILIAVVLAGCKTLIAPSRVELRFVESEISDSVPTGWRLRERTLQLKYAVRANGLKGKRLLVRSYASERGFVAETYWEPDSDQTEWKLVFIHIPLSVVHGESQFYVSTYVVSPNAQDSYFAYSNESVDLSFRRIPSIWGLEAFEEKGREVRASFWIDSFRHAGFGFTTWLVIEKGLETMVVRGPGRRVPSKREVFRNIEFRVPYDDIARELRAQVGDKLIYYPIAYWDGNQIVSNLMIDGFAYGDPDVVSSRLASARANAMGVRKKYENVLEIVQEAVR